MISERDEEQRDERKSLALSLFASAIINMLAWMLVIWGYAFHLKVEPPKFTEREEVLSSTSIRIEKRTIPNPREPVPQPEQQRPPRQIKIPVPQPHAQPTEIARIVQRATPQPRQAKAQGQRATLEQQLAEQNKMFARQAQQLNSARAPLSIATIAPQPPSAFRRSAMDLSGNSQRESTQAVLDPIKHFTTGDMSCYYVHYFAQYSGGGSEEGNIPWPLCYPIAHDAFLPLDKTHWLPIPAPPKGWTLPAGDTLQPLLKRLYDGEIKPEATP